MATKKISNKTSKKNETGQERLQRLSDTYQYAVASKSYNSPSASTRSNTSGRNFSNYSNQILAASRGKEDVSTYTIAISKRNRMLLDSGQSISPIGTNLGLTSIKNLVVDKKQKTGMGGNPKTVAKPKTNKK